MVTWAIRPIHPVYRRDSDVFKNYDLASGETFKAGAFVLRDSDGNFAEVGAAPALIAGVALAAVDDYSWKDDTFGTVDPSVPVAMADQEFRGTLEGTFAAADVGDEFGVVLDASGYWTIDKTETGTTQVQVTGKDDAVAVGDINAPVRFIVLPANRQVIS